MTARISQIDDAMWARMQNRSVRADMACPPREALRVVNVPYTSISGRQLHGDIVVAAEVADEVARIFERIHASGRFRFGGIRPAWQYGGSDRSSMAANNTVGFNCQSVALAHKLSAHAAGLAIDINPITNPHVTAERTWPRAGRDYDEERERALSDAGLRGIIRPGDVVVRAFKEAGWSWGGERSDPKDYQHFQKVVR